MTAPTEDAKKMELLPCPFCGAKAGVMKRHCSLSAASVYQACCSDSGCPANGTFDTEDAAAFVWNTRTPQSPAVSDEPEQSCANCPKDIDCEDYRIDGQPCEGKKDWFKCDQCGKYLPTENGLAKHKLYHATAVSEEVRDAVEWARNFIFWSKSAFPDNCNASATLDVERLETLIRAATQQTTTGK